MMLMKTRFGIVWALVAILSFFSCGKVGELVIDDDDWDPEGTIIVKIRSKETTSIGRYENTYFYLGVDNSNNLIPSSSSYSPYSASISTIGKGNYLGEINTSVVPSTGWGQKVAALKGYLMIARFESEENTYYWGIQVVDTMTSTDNGIIGFTVKYCPFTLEAGWK